ncbi:elongation of very long chain fatty acids protein 4 [Aedes aegypti]|uniref:Elongation of very long chain fatty acids protein n=1 Tax=Aedes aegypti TaxID=7159 RepID=A0A1S4F942_AEDAE|nr:elongation of very long chain fatty acids protein 4 [Aedes aegypti]
MEIVLAKMVGSYNQFMWKNRDLRSADFPLLSSNWQVPAIIVVYMLTVLKFGPRFMATRKAYDLTKYIRMYNIVQIVTNGVLFSFLVYHLLKRPTMSYVCQSVDFSKTTSGYEELYILYAYFVLKILDLSDTVFFVLRKKQSQVTFLHVYHHSIMVLISYYGTLFVPGGHNFVLVLWNSIGHSLLYLYYNLTTYKSPLAARYKIYLTRMQLAQFVYLVVHYGRPALTGMDCGFPKLWHWTGFTQTLFFLGMFLDFYVKSYIKRNVEKDGKIDRKAD